MGIKNHLRKLSRLIPSRFYLQLMHKRRTGEWMSFANPRTYTEKLQWLKLHDREAAYLNMVDKYEAKKYVGERIGNEHIVPLLGVWDNADSIDFNKLPDQFVLKCTHNSGGLIVCTDKSSLDIEAARRKLNKQLSENFYWHGREWTYKHIRPRVIAEKYMQDTRLHDLRDYKFFTFNGVPKIVHIVSNRQVKDEETYGDFFDMDYNHLDLTMGHDNAPVPPEKPVNFEKMKEYSVLLARNTKHLRVDFYEVDGQLYFGELTFFQDCGFSDVQPPELNAVIGSRINLK